MLLIASQKGCVKKEKICTSFYFSVKIHIILNIPFTFITWGGCTAFLKKNYRELFLQEGHHPLLPYQPRQDAVSSTFASSSCPKCLMRRALGFLVQRFWLFSRSVFRFLCQNMSVFGFGVYCCLRIFHFLAFGFRFSSKNTKRFSDLVSDVAFGFSFLGSGLILIWAANVRLLRSGIAAKPLYAQFVTTASHR